LEIAIVEQRVRENPGVHEVWKWNMSPDELSRCRELSRFYIINFGSLPWESLFWILVIYLPHSVLFEIVTFEKGKSALPALQYEII
jgi:hypothetical protein